MRQELALLSRVEQSKAELETELAKMSMSAEWGKSAARLLQLPGLGLITAMTVLAAGGGIGGKKPERRIRLSALNPFGRGQCPPPVRCTQCY